MTVILTGANGMLGRDIHTALSNSNFQVIALTHQQLDITDPKRIKRTLDALHVKNGDWLINCAAFTQVDACETQEELAFQVNGEGARLLAEWCNKNNVHMIHFSTDYVFDGEKETPYSETDITNPINRYGASKLMGEKAVLAFVKNGYVLRVQWLFGQHGPNFVKTMLKLATENPTLKVVNDQWGSPTSTESVASAIVSLLKNPIPFGLYHFHNEGYTTWYDFTREIIKHLPNPPDVIPVSSAEFPRPAKRPKNGQLDMKKWQSTGAPTPPTWQAALSQFLKP